MDKKGMIHWLFLFILVAGVFIFLFFAKDSLNIGSLLSFVGGDTYVSVEGNEPGTQGGGEDYSGAPDDSVVDSGRVGLGTYFEHNFPIYIDSRKTNCLLVGGTWISGDSRVGCYDIPAWDSSLCGSAELWTLKSVCVNLGALFTCDSHEVSCEYA